MEQTKARNDFMMTLELRLAGYDILRNLFVAEPTIKLMTDLFDCKLLKQFPYTNECSTIHKGVVKVEEFFAENSPKDQDVFEALHWDYTRMFIGPYTLPAPPWGSAYLDDDRVLFQEETLNVRRAYLKYGFLSKQSGQEAEDHIGLELDFMFQLTKLTIDMFNSGDVAKTEALLKDQQLFLENHLLSWVEKLCVDMKEAANTSFYEGVSDILKGFLNLDKKILEEMHQFLFITNG